MKEDNVEIKSPSICRVISVYQSAYPDPLVIKAGEELIVGKKESEWSGWVWCTNQNGKSGWVPKKYVAHKGYIWVARFDYDATELSVDIGEELIMGYEESGWIWCTDQQGRHGWVPADHLEILGEGSKQ
ncbi:MAG: SH3 domain-containing protein [Anaerolineae bacterium]|nr:SH3 domain-containing protein [Anaerolineae bacterium]